jgi:hypothetical protein
MTTVSAGGSADRLTPLKRARRDLAVATVLGVSMLILLYSARTIPNSAYEPMGPRFLAVLVPSLILVLAVLLVLRSILTIRQEQRGPVVAPSALQAQPWQRPFIVLLLLALYGVLLWFEVLYVPATAFFIMTAAFILDSRQLTPGRRLRANVQVIVVAWVVAFVVHKIFVDVLSVLLP